MRYSINIVIITIITKTKTPSKGEYDMKTYLCPCGYEYNPELGDPDNGIAPGTAWEDVPEDWLCPWCSLGKEVFEEQ